MQAQSPNKITISVGGKRFEVERARLRLWFELEDIRSKIKDAVEEGDTNAVSMFICSYLSTASGQDQGLFLETIWIETALAFMEINELNSPRISIPMFTIKSDRENDDTVSWDYDSRTWYLWVHSLARVYGWSVEYISDLEIETGLALLQEITIDDQLQKEWDWGRTELAYKYDPVTKSSRFSPLDRPMWMRPRAKKVKKTKMVKAWLPIGNIENLSGMGLHGTEEDAIH